MPQKLPARRDRNFLFFMTGSSLILLGFEFSSVHSLSQLSMLSHAIVSKRLDLIKRFYLLVGSLQLDQGKLIRDLFGS